MSVFRLCLLCGVLVYSTNPLVAQSGTTRDPSGDPLPPGAFARIGSGRFWIGNTVLGARYLDGGKKLLVRVQETDRWNPWHEGEFRLFDAENGTALGSSAVKLNSFFVYWPRQGEDPGRIIFPNWCISADGRLFARVADSSIGDLQVRAFPGGEVVFAVKSNNEVFAHVQFSPDGKRIAAVVRTSRQGSKKDGTPPVVIRMWDLSKAHEPRTFVPPGKGQEAFQAQWFAFSPDGAYLAAMGYEQGKAGVVRIWDTRGGKPAVQLEGEAAKRTEPRPVVFSPDSKSLAAVHDGKIRLWDPATGNRLKDVADYQERCATLDFSPNGKLLIAAGVMEEEKLGKVRMWNLSSGEEVPLPRALTGSYLFSGDSVNLFLADVVQKCLVVCDAATGRIRSKMPMSFPASKEESIEQLYYKARQGMGWPFAVSPDGQIVVAGDSPGQLKRFAQVTGQPIPAPGLKIDPASALAFSPDGKKLVVAGRDRLLLFDSQGKKPPTSLVANPSAKEGAEPADKPQDCALAFSSDGQRIAAGRESGLLSVWGTATGKLLWQTHDHEYGIVSLEFIGDGQTLVSGGGRDGQLIWWNALTGQRERKMAQNTERESYARGEFRLAPGATTAFFNHHTLPLVEWELASGKARREIKAALFPFAFSADGRFALAGNSAGCFSLIDLKADKCLRSFAYLDSRRALPGWHKQACFSPDGRVIAAVAGFEVVRLWDRDTATVLADFAGHTGGALTMAFAPDGKTLATSAGDGTILLWHVPPLPNVITKALSLPKTNLPVGAKDGDGDDLPEGARTRLGSLRFQHGEEVLGLRFSSDGNSILTQTIAGRGVTWSELVLWDAGTGKLKAQLPVAWAAGGGPMTGIPHIDSWTVSPDAKLVATSSSYPEKNRLGGTKGFSVREISTGKIVYQPKDTEEGSGRVKFSPDSKMLLVVYDLSLIDLKSGSMRKLQRKDEKEGTGEALFSPDCKILLAWTGGGLGCWHLEPGGTPVRLSHRLSHDTAVFHPSSKQIAGFIQPAKDAKARLVLVDLESGKVTRDFGEHREWNVRMQFSPDGKELMMLTSVPSGMEFHDDVGTWRPSQQSLRRWQVATGKELPVVKSTGGMVADYSPDGRILAVGTGQHLLLLDAVSGRELRRLPLEAYLPEPRDQIEIHRHFAAQPFAFSPDGTRVAVAAGRAIRQFDVATGIEIGPTPHWEMTQGLSVAKNGKWVASWSLGYVQVWDVARNRVAFRVEPWSSGKSKISLTGAVFSPDGNLLAVSASDGELALFNVLSAKKLHQFQFHKAPIASLEFLADGATLVSSDVGGQVAVWNVESAKLLRNYSLPGLDSKYISTELEVRFFDELTLKSGKTPWDWVYWRDLPALAPLARWLVIRGVKQLSLHEFGAAKSRILSVPQLYGQRVAVSGDGRLMAMTRMGPALVVYAFDTATGKELRAFASPWGSTDYCFSGDGALLAAYGAGGFWISAVATGTRLVEVQCHRGGASTLAFSPDGGTLVTAGFDGTLLVWDVASITARPKLKELSSGDLSTLWQQLADSDAGIAGSAIRQLVQHPLQATPFLGEKLKPVASVPMEAIERLLPDLDDDRPKVRASATAELEKLAELAEPALRTLLAGTPTLEQRQRAERLLTLLSSPITDGDKLRSLRSVEALALIGTPAAIGALKFVGHGAEAAYVTRAAKAAVRRLEQPR